MYRSHLLKSLTQADAVEESLISSLTQIMLFYAKSDLGVGLSEEENGELINLLETLKKDSEKHKAILNKTRNYILNEDKDDF